MTSDHRLTWLPHLLIGILTSLASIQALSPSIDVDTWWHLRVAQWIDEHHQLPNTDPFSRYGIETHKEWIAYSWLWEQILYRCYQFHGIEGTLLFRYVMVMLVLITWAAILFQMLRSPVLGIVCFALSIVCLHPMWTTRPWHFTILGTILTLYSCKQLYEGANGPYFWGLPCIYAIWANVHIQFVLGFAVIACAWLGFYCDKRLFPKTITYLGVTCFIATLLNPYTYQLYWVIIEYAGHTFALRAVVELAPPDWKEPWTWATWISCGLAFVDTIRRNPKSVFAWSLLLCGLFFSMRMRRDLWFGAATAVTVMSLYRNAPLESLSVRRTAIIVFGTLSLGWMGWYGVVRPHLDWQKIISKEYPLDAVQHVLHRRYSPPMYNSFDWGGFLIFYLPQYPVSIDGRTNLHTDTRLERYALTWAGLGDWQEDPDLRVASFIIAPVNQPLTNVLRQDASWTIDYEDALAVVFVRRKTP